MTANEIRGFNQNHLPPGYPILEAWVQEIAAQLAEANEHLKYLAHPLIRVSTPGGKISYSGDPIDIHGVQVRDWVIGDQITIDGESWVVTSRADRMATLMKEA